jgi:hypothetical protein
MSQFIELGCSAELNPAYGVLRFCFRLCCTHTDPFFLVCLKPERQGLKPKKTHLYGTEACSGFNGVILICRLLHSGTGMAFLVDARFLYKS